MGGKVEDVLELYRRLEGPLEMKVVRKGKMLMVKIKSKAFRIEVGEDNIQTYLEEDGGVGFVA